LIVDALPRSANGKIDRKMLLSRILIPESRFPTDT
jgi:acyl-coenzyme A synthetase/AMP-(fatty) acid ligase